MIFPLRTLLGWCALATLAMAAPIPDDFPRFIVPGHEAEMDAVRALYWRHYEHAGPLITLWDEWMASPTLFFARWYGAFFASALSVTRCFTAECGHPI